MKPKPYLKFRYYYPPRPEYKIPSSELPKYEKDCLAQPKFNGCCMMIYIKGDEVRNFGRHYNENLSNFKLTDEELQFLNCKNDGWNVFVGEYMNKNKNGVDGKPWNHKLVIFDVLVYDGEYLIGSTFQERVSLLDKLFGTNSENEYLYKVNDANIFRVKTFYGNFKEMWDKIVKIDMLEGFVLKKKDQKLAKGLSEKNNMSVKCRKETKLYNF